jgi:hypothetical protein
VAGQRDDSDSTLIRVRRLLARPAASSCLRWQWASVQHRLGVSGVRLLDGHVEAGPFGYGGVPHGYRADDRAGCAKV